MKMISALALVFLFGSLANANNKPADSPFLGSTKDFKKAEKGKELFVQRNPEKKAVDYKKVIFDPVLIYPSRNARYKQLTQDEIVLLSGEFKKNVEEKFKDTVQIVSVPGPGVLRVRFAMRGLKKGNYYMDEKGDHKIETNSRMAAGTFEMDAIDSLTGERIVALYQSVGNEQFEKSEKEETTQTVQALFSDWVDILKRVYLENSAAATIPK